MRASQTEPTEQGQEHSNHYYYLPSFISLFLCKGEVSFIMIIIKNNKYIYMVWFIIILVLLTSQGCRVGKRSTKYNI